MRVSRSFSAMAVIAALELATFIPAHCEPPNSSPTVSLPLQSPPIFLSSSPLLIRIFKEESQLELWMRKGERFELFASYPICSWSGTLGPKEYEGDRQAPEGFYTVDLRQLGASGRHPYAIDVGYPNVFDRSLGRTGSHILLHGGCRSLGCFAMTDPIMDHLYVLAELALRAGQEHIQVHIFPFRMTEANLQQHANSRWYAFWSNLRQGYDLFEATRMAPVVHACQGSYLLTRNEEAASDQCISLPPAPEEEAKINPGARASTGVRALLASRANRARLRLPPVRTAGALVHSRDNVVECARLWTRNTGVSRQNWDAICKRLDFQPKGLLRSVHRQPRHGQLPRT